MVIDPLTDHDADRIFHALADATRRDILREVGGGGEFSVSALARRYPISVTAVQKHVGVLELAGLITKQRRGREQIVRADPATLQRARELINQLEQVWRARLAQFADALADQQEGAAP